MEKEFTADQIPQILLERGWEKYGYRQFIKGLSVLHLYSGRLRFWEDLRAASVVCCFDLPISESDFNNLVTAPFWCMDEGDGKPRCKVQCPFCERV